MGRSALARVWLNRWRSATGGIQLTASAVDFANQRPTRQVDLEAPRAFNLRNQANTGHGLGLPLQEISEKLGFGDQSHFATVFRKSVGMTPEQFRDCSCQ